MLWLDWRLALVTLAITPILVVLAYRYSHVSHPLLRDVQQKMADVATVAEENIVGVHVVKSFAQEQQEQAKFTHRSDEVFRQWSRPTGSARSTSHCISFIPLVAQAAVLLVGGRMVANGDMSLGGFFAFNLLVLMLVVPLRMLGMWIGQAQRATASGERIFEVMDEPEEIADRPDAIELPAGDGPHPLRGCELRLRGRRPVLEDVDLDVEPGRTVALIGHTGSGKTTLASLVPRFYDVTAGRVTVDGADVRDVTLASLRRAIGIVAQDPFLFSATRAREHRVRRARTRPTRRSSGPRSSRRRTSSSSELPGRLRHGHRRARDHALRRAAAADRDRAGARSSTRGS